MKKGYLFDTKVQLLKYKVLRSVARHAWEDELDTCYYDTPLEIVPRDEATMRCCIYKERAIIAERIRMAMGGDKNNENVIEVLDIACDECPVSGYRVSDACRGCIAHRCVDVCPVGAITADNHCATIDPNKCISCGKCASVCPYSAILFRRRPCEVACKIKAISMDAKDNKAEIDNSKCISCGACMYQCPFGAIADKSYIVDTIRLMKKSGGNKQFKMIAVVAPSIASQYSHVGVTLGQVVSGIKALGFHDVVEAALGADMVAYKEAGELAEKGFLTSSCCPAFVDHIEKAFPQLKDHISHNVSPVMEISRFIKQTDPDCKIIFIGPCTAKKMEFRKEKVKGIVDYVLTFEELQALFDSRDIALDEMEESVLDNASYYGRIFARSGGLTDAVREALKEQDITEDKFQFKPIACDGIEACKMALLKASKGVLAENFIEGMACVNGCIGGAGCLTHGPKDKTEVDRYGKQAMAKDISDAISIYELKGKAGKAEAAPAAKARKK